MQVHEVPNHDAIELRRLRHELEEARRKFGDRADAVRRMLTGEEGSLAKFDDTYAYLVDDKKK